MVGDALKVPAALPRHCAAGPDLRQAHQDDRRRCRCEHAHWPLHRALLEHSTDARLPPCAGGGPRIASAPGVPARVKDLHQFPCGVWSQGTTAYWRLGKEIFKPEPTIVTNDYTHLCNRALAGDVVTELPPFMTMEHIKNQQLVALLEDHPLPDLEITLHYASHPHPSPIVQTYLDFARQHIKHPARFDAHSTELTHA